MELIKNKIYFNFKLIKVDDIDEIHSKGFVFEHIKTKTKLFYLKNDNNDKSFAITFKTYPKDSSGVAHILEHSVLNGSKRYPLKDPFMELNRSTINTFLNAFTFPDKTMYPFSTTNPSEYLKIMDVYLDAVFFPLVLENKKIFLQEGWRYELFNKDETLKFNGVVYSEMKGVMSNPVNLLFYHSQQNLLKDTIYGHNSGGDPICITKLTYEDFLAFHQKYYHPSNANIVLFGNLNIFESLKLIDENFLSKFDFLEIEDKIEFQKNFDKQVKIEEKYSYSGEDFENKNLFGLSFVIGKALDLELMLSFKLLSSILLDLEASPLKKALIEADIGEEVFGGFQEDLINQPIFGVYINNANSNKKEKFKEIFNLTLTQLIQKGIDKDLILAVINSKEFSFKEGKLMDEDYLTKGIEYSFLIQDSFIYDGDPFLFLKYLEIFNQIKEKAFSGFFEDLIKKYLLENNHSVYICLSPDKNVNYEQIEHKNLLEYRKTLLDDEINFLIKQSNEVLEYQKKEEEPSITNLIKIIDKKDINLEPENFIYTQIKNSQRLKLFSYKSKVDEITYLDFYFNLNISSKEELQYLAFFLDFIEELGTDKISSDNLSNQLHKYFGSLSFNLTIFTDKSTGIVTPKILVSSKFFTKNKKEVFSLFNEIFNNLIISLKKVKEMLKQLKSEISNSIISSGHRFSMSYINSNLSKSGVFNEFIEGVTFYEFICDTLNKIKNNENEVIDKLNNIYKKNFILDDIEIIFSSDEDISNEFPLIKFKNIKKDFNSEKILTFNSNNCAIVCSTNVNYVAQGGSFLPDKYNGDFLVLKKLLSRKYLYEEIRVKGGAYGNGSIFNSLGEANFFSYRDPNFLDTFNVYSKIPDFLDNLSLNHDDFFRYIISVISDLDSPLEVEEIIKKIMFEKFSGISFEDKLILRKEVLNSNLEKIKKLSVLIKEILEQKKFSAVCMKSAYEKKKDLFDKVVYI